MALLNKLQFKQILNEDPPQKRAATVEQWDLVFEHAAKLFSKLKLKPRKLTRKDAGPVYQCGSRSLYYVRALPQKETETYVIVVCGGQGQPQDHILIDLLAEYAALNLDAPQFGFFESVREHDIQRVIAGIDPHKDNPFAVLGVAHGGTYMQTYREAKGFLLEYQLVNTSSHYAASKLLTAEQVIDAMTSYAFGKDEWLRAFKWKKINLD